MPVIADFSIARNQDFTLPINLEPATNVSGWAVQFLAQNHFGGVSGYMLKSAASGFNNVSGVNCVDGVQGRFTVKVFAQETSGLAFGNIAYSFNRMDSGFHTPLVLGFLTIAPGPAV